MANDPGEWYEEKRLEAERLRHELAGARQVLTALDDATDQRGRLHDVARAVVRRLERQLEAARYVGD